MQVLFKVNERFTVSGQGATQKEAFADLASNIEPFAVSECGACKGKDIFPRVRQNKKFTYYEMVCRNPKCRCKLSYGQSTENGALYPRRKYHEQHPDVKDKKVKLSSDKPTYLPNGGWESWTKDEEEE